MKGASPQGSARISRRHFRLVTARSGNHDVTDIMRPARSGPVRCAGTAALTCNSAWHKTSGDSPNCKLASMLW
jgi:hypothetical protein